MCYDRDESQNVNGEKKPTKKFFMSSIFKVQK